MRWLLLILILCLGCLDSAEPTRGPYGVWIKAFEPDVSEVRSGNQVSVRLSVENIGDSDAENVKAWIFNCGDFTDCDEEKDMHTLSRSDLKANLPGESKEVVWKISSNKLLSKNEKARQDIGVKVSYDYTSSAELEIPILSEDKFRELERLGRLSSSRVESSFSPLGIKITAPNRIIGAEPFTIKIDLEKIEEGFVAGCDGKAGCIDSVTISPGPGLSKVSGGCDDLTNFDLWRSGTASASCILEADADCGDECYPTVKVTAKYGFVIEKFTSVTIIGTGEVVEVEEVVPEIPPEEEEEEEEEEITPLICPEGVEGKAVIYSLKPVSGVAGSSVIIIGANYGVNETNINIKFDNGISYIEELEATPVGGSPGSKNNIEANENGCFKVRATIPSDAPLGEFLIYALGDGLDAGEYTSGDYLSGGKNFLVIEEGVVEKEQAKISLWKDTIVLGEKLLVTGRGYWPEEDNIEIHIEGKMLYENRVWIKEIETVRKLEATPAGSGTEKGSEKGTIKADKDGNFMAYVTLPFETMLGISYIYATGAQACTVPPKYEPETAYANKQAIELKGVAYIKDVNPESLKIGETGIIKGRDFSGNEDNIRVYLAPAGTIKDSSKHIKLEMSSHGIGLAGTEPGTLKATDSGYIEGEFTTPTGPSSGDYNIYAIGPDADQEEKYTKEQALNGRKIIFIEFDIMPSDSDEDGIDDLKDECPGTPLGIPVDSKGCPKLYISMVGSATCDYNTNGNAKIIMRIENSASSKVYDIYGYFKDSASPGVKYSTICFSKTFIPGEEFDAPATIRDLKNGKHEITALIYLGQGSDAEIWKDESLEFEVPSDDCPEIEIVSADTDKEKYELSEDVEVDIIIKNTGSRDIEKLNISIEWILDADGRVLDKKEFVIPLAAGSEETHSRTSTELDRYTGMYKVRIRVAEIREPVEILLAEKTDIVFQKIA